MKRNVRTAANTFKNSFFTNLNNYAQTKSYRSQNSFSSLNNFSYSTDLTFQYPMITYRYKSYITASESTDIKSKTSSSLNNFSYPTSLTFQCPLISYGYKSYIAASESADTKSKISLTLHFRRATSDRYKSDIAASESAGTKSKTSNDDFGVKDVDLILGKFATKLAGGRESSNLFRDMLLLAIQHGLGTTPCIFRAAQPHGLTKILFGDKGYSTHPGTKKELEKICTKTIWYDPVDQLGYGDYSEAFGKRVAGRLWLEAQKYMEDNKWRPKFLCVLDDGAFLIKSIPGTFLNGSQYKYKPEDIIGIEQTNGGARRINNYRMRYPIINVAGSFIKYYLEYPYVAETVVKKLMKFIESEEWEKKPVIGVVGYGYLGAAIARTLAQKDYRVIIYDKAINTTNMNSNNFEQAPSLELLLANADLVISSTGNDITSAKSALEAITFGIQKKQVLISASSTDIEFNSVLRYIHNKTLLNDEPMPNPYADIIYKTDSGKQIKILNGGFPFNFDRSRHSVPPKQILPTRLALLGSLFMARYMRDVPELKHSSDIFMLHQFIQLSIFQIYQELNPHDNNCEKIFKELMPSGFNESTLVEHINRFSEGKNIHLFWNETRCEKPETNFKISAMKEPEGPKLL